MRVESLSYTFIDSPLLVSYLMLLATKTDLKDEGEDPEERDKGKKKKRYKWNSGTLEEILTLVPVYYRTFSEEVKKKNCIFPVKN